MSITIDNLTKCGACGYIASLWEFLPTGNIYRDEPTCPNCGQTESLEDYDIEKVEVNNAL